MHEVLRVLHNLQDPQWRSRLKKDPGIPNLFPYKDKILHDIEEKKRLRIEEAALRKESLKGGVGDKVVGEENATSDQEDDGIEGDALSDLLDDESMDEAEEAGGSNPMAALLASARERALEYGDDEGVGGEGAPMNDDDSDVDINIATTSNSAQTTQRGSDPTTRNFTNVYRTVLQNSDIILYVLDARDPNGTRSREVEREIMSSGDGSKRLILILNKIDLVPPTVLEAWLKYLRRYFPTLPLRANPPASNAKTFDHKALTVKGTSETLLRALKSYAHSQNARGSTTVGIVGYPNVGKSSVINALASRLGSSKASKTSCPVGAEAGVTRSLRQVKLDNKLKILDSPGIVFESSTTATTFPPHLTRRQGERASLILLSALPPSAIDDPIPAITLLLHRLSSTSATLDPLMDYYGINHLALLADDGDLTSDFLVHVARKRGRLGKGGVPSLNGAAMGVLADWRDGRIRGWVERPPPTEENNGTSAAEHKTIVHEWSKEFRLDGLWGEETNEDDNDGMEH